MTELSSAESKAPPAASLRAVGAAYDGQLVLDGVSVEVPAGRFVAFLGPSGAGKTTLLRLLLGLLRPTSGTIEILGTTPDRARARVGYVPQLEEVDWTFPITVEQVVGLGWGRSLKPWLSAEQKRRVRLICEKLGLEGLERRQIGELSGGQQQRAFLARALVKNPELLVLDEPTASTDLGTKATIMDILSSLASRGIAVVITTHDINLVANRVDTVVLLNKRIVAQGHPREVLDAASLSRTYGKPIFTVEHEGQLLVAEVPQQVDHSHHLHVHHDHGVGEPSGEMAD